MVKSSIISMSKYKRAARLLQYTVAVASRGQNRVSALGLELFATCSGSYFAAAGFPRTLEATFRRMLKTLSRAADPKDKSSATWSVVVVLQAAAMPCARPQR